VDDNAQRFISAFNDIESHLRKTLKADVHVGFQTMARRYVDDMNLPPGQGEELAAMARLRNAISHGRFLDGRPVADPRPDLVNRIEQLRELYLKPPTALGILGQTEVCSVSPDQPVRAALEYVRLFDYSQLPVYDHGGYAGILTTNTVARWLAAQLDSTGGLAESESIGHVLAFTEQHERACHVPRSVTAATAIHQLSRGGHAGKPLTALIITDSGKPAEKPLAIVVDDDLPVLASALAAG
jgi:predicted transcriptional regulator